MRVRVEWAGASAGVLRVAENDKVRGSGQDDGQLGWQARKAEILSGARKDEQMKRWSLALRNGRLF